MSNPMSLAAILNPVPESDDAPSSRSSQANKSSRSSPTITPATNASSTTSATVNDSNVTSPICSVDMLSRNSLKRRREATPPSSPSPSLGPTRHFTSINAPNLAVDQVAEEESESDGEPKPKKRRQSDKSASSGAASVPSTVARQEDNSSDDEEDADQTSTNPRFPPGTVCMTINCPFRPAPPQVETKFRTCISDHFGRNKKETKRIKTFWTVCRKCYQHGDYKKYSWPERKCDLILKQLIFICADEGCLDLSHDAISAGVDLHLECSDQCEVRYKIVLRRQETDRIKKLEVDYDGNVEAYIASGVDQDAMVKLHQDEKKGDMIIHADEKGHSRWGRQSKSYLRSPIDALLEFKDLFVGENKTRAQCIEAVEYCREAFLGQEIDDLIRFECLVRTPRITREIAETDAAQRAASRAKAREKAAQRKAETAREKNATPSGAQVGTSDTSPPTTSAPDSLADASNSVKEQDKIKVKFTPKKRKADDAFEEQDASTGVTDEVTGSPRAQRVKLTFSGDKRKTGSMNDIPQAPADEEETGGRSTGSATAVRDVDEHEDTVESTPSYKKKARSVASPKSPSARRGVRKSARR